MYSRFVPITVAMVSLAVSVFFILYFDGLWRWFIASPMLVFVTWTSFKIGFFSPQEEVDRMTGADQLSREGLEGNLMTMLIQLLSLVKYPALIMSSYLAYSGYEIIIIPIIGFVVTAANTFDSTRYNILRARIRSDGYIGVFKALILFFIPDVLSVGVFYGMGILIRQVI